MPQRRQEVVDLLTSFLTKLGQAGPYGAEFVSLYMALIRTDHWRYYLVCQGFLPRLAEFIQVIDLYHLISCWCSLVDFLCHDFSIF